MVAEAVEASRTSMPSTPILGPTPSMHRQATGPTTSHGAASPAGSLVTSLIAALMAAHSRALVAGGGGNRGGRNRGNNHHNNGNPFSRTSDSIFNAAPRGTRGRGGSNGAGGGFGFLVFNDDIQAVSQKCYQHSERVVAFASA